MFAALLRGFWVRMDCHRSDFFIQGNDFGLKVGEFGFKRNVPQFCGSLAVEGVKRQRQISGTSPQQAAYRFINLVHRHKQRIRALPFAFVLCAQKPH